MSHKKWNRWLDGIVNEIGAFYDAPAVTKNVNGHIKFTLTHRAEKRVVIVSSSPRNKSSAEKHTVRDFNRALRDLGINERIVLTVPCPDFSSWITPPPKTEDLGQSINAIETPR